MMLRTRLIAGPGTALVLSAVFATIMVFVQTAETLIEPLRVDPTRPAPVTLRLPPITLQVLGDEDDPGPKFRTAAIRIARGEVVQDPRIRSLVRIHERTRRPPPPEPMIGLWFVYFLVAMMLTSYLRSFSPHRGSLLRTQVGLVGLLVILLSVAKAVLLLSSFSEFVIPAGALSLWIALYLDRRTAFIVSIALSFLLSSFVGFRLAAVAVYLAGSLASVMVFRNIKRSASMIYAGLFSALVGAVVVIAAKALFEGQFASEREFSNWWNSDILSAALGGGLSGILAFMLQNFAEVVLGAVSRNRLLELTDLDQPLLRKMAREAPGSWEHSRAMANLAEAAAASIGADPVLTRVGAYYHDLGKTCQPKLFVENLEPGETTPHAELEPDVSADAIMAHVVEGTKILRKGGIPEAVVEFAYTHHGTSVIEFFWHKCLEQGNPKQLSDASFRYPGMRPRNKETAILMIVDSVEAAARTVETPNKEEFEKICMRIFFVKLRQGQLDESGLTMEDVRVLVQRLTDTLCSVYHHRIKYPWQSQHDAGKPQPPMPNAPPSKVPAPNVPLRSAPVPGPSQG